MRFSFHYFSLRFNDSFHLARGSRSNTFVVLLELYWKEHTGYGEAVLPPYRSTSSGEVVGYFQHNLQKKDNPADILKQLPHPEHCPEGRAAVEMALYDLLAKDKSMPLHHYLGYSGTSLPDTTITLSPEYPDGLKELLLKMEPHFKQFKLKLGRKYDRSMIRTFRQLTNADFWVDANGGWKDPYYALDMIHFIKEAGGMFIEQPIDDPAGLKWLVSKSPLPVILDESFQHARDLEEVRDYCHGINIKLMKCGGITSALKILEQAKKQNLQVLMGCMSGSSCAVTAAAHLAEKVDYADLDGPFLLQNDPFSGLKVQNKQFLLPGEPGLGVVPSSSHPGAKS